MSLREQVAEVANLAGRREVVEETKRVLLTMDQDTRTATVDLMLPAYQALAGHYNEMCAFLRALQVGASGSA